MGVRARTLASTRGTPRKIRIIAKAEKCKRIGELMPIWLVLLNEYWLADADTYREALASISRRHPFEKILLINSDGSVSRLFEAS